MAGVNVIHLIYRLAGLKETGNSGVVVPAVNQLNKPMIKSTARYALMGVAALAIAAMPLYAQDKPAAEKAGGKPKKEAAEKAAPSTGEKPSRATPFKGKLDAKSATSITVGARTFEVTSETKFVKAGKDKDVTLADGEVGKEVGGSYVKDGDKLVAKMIRFGPKPEATEAAKKEKADKAEKKAGKAAGKVEKPATKN